MTRTSVGIRISAGARSEQAHLVFLLSTRCKEHTVKGYRSPISYCRVVNTAKCEKVEVSMEKRESCSAALINRIHNFSLAATTEFLIGNHKIPAFSF